ncbi:MAG TPA: TetR/AcrR family transcriptional regulator [Bacteroidia bacterium]|jgi:AcrR family transcriptional regulator|nr:TetR/AcrR family transcriptional regulator [Bacteroidia bacterium]
MRTESREKILKAAIRLFVEKGFHDTTTREITEAAGISKGLLYNYFASKEAILCGIIDDRTQNLGDVIALCKVPGDAGATLTRFIAAYCGMLRRDRDYLRFRTALVLQPGIPAAVTDLISDRVGDLFEAICGMLAEVGIPDARMVTYGLMARLEGMGVHYLGILRNYPLDEMERKITQEYAEKYV